MLDRIQSLLGDIPDHLQGGILGAMLAVLAFLAPRIWDLYKKRFEQWAQRSPLEREVPEPTDRQFLALLRDELRQNLDRLDADNRWEHRRFVRLDAEVNVIRGDRVRRRVMDLLTAIRRSRRDRLFLVIGDPGSGKSVALRKLCRELLTRSPKANRQLPIYINLREWSPKAPCANKSPTEDDLRAFILQNVKQRVSASLHGFLDQWLLELLSRGRLFLILDSFDEIPAVMDSDERSELVLQLSDVIARTARSGATGRTVLASRPFRRPRFSLEDTGRRPSARRNMPVFELRPFSDIKIAKAIDQAAKDPLRPLSNPAAVKHALFHDRPDLSSILRTPFMLGLTIDYWEAHPGKMPATQAELYESFIERSLRRAESVIRKHALDKNALHACASAIAREMFESDDYGLDIPVRKLCKRLPDLPVLPAVTALRQAHIARPSESDSFSFVHRRFHEYFLIDHFHANPDKLPYEAIWGDTRWREGFALYCEIAPEPIAKDIVRCCSMLFLAKAGDGIGEQTAVYQSAVYRRALHSLRFLATAFRARREAVEEIEPLLALQIQTNVRGEDLLLAKHSIEASGLLSEKSAQDVVTTALSSGSSWLTETAFHASRHLPRISLKNQLLVTQRLLRTAPAEQLKTYRDIMFSLQSTAGLSLARWIYGLRSWETILVLGGIIFCAAFSSTFRFFLPIMAVSLLLFSSMAILIDWGQRREDTALVARYVLRDPVRFLNVAAESAFVVIVVRHFGDASVSNLEAGGGGFLPYVSWLEVGLLVAGLLIVRPVTLGFQIFMACFSGLENWNRAKKLATILGRDYLYGSFLVPVYAFFVLTTLVAAVYALYYFGVFDAIGRLELVRHWSVRDILLPLSIFLSAGYALALFINNVGNLRSDQRTLEKLGKALPISRTNISYVLDRLKTEGFRLKYLEWVEAQCGEPPIDSWPGGERPRRRNDQASEVLARLDERWLGLDQ
jgi:hypothetical protein